MREEEGKIGYSVTVLYIHVHVHVHVSVCRWFTWTTMCVLRRAKV